MPVNKNAMTRYKILDELLSNRYHNYSLDDLTCGVNEALEEIGISAVSRRCIEKDIQYIENEGPFMVEIERYSAEGFKADTQKSYTKRCLRYSDSSFSIFKKAMNDDEKSLLSDALSILGQFEGLPNFGGLEQLKKSLGVHRKNDIISMSKNPLEKSTLIGELFTAISNKQVLEIDYRKFSNKEKPNKIIVHPYLLKEYNRRWHLFARNNEYDSIINLALDRIKAITPLPQYTYKENDENFADIFEEIVGLTFMRNNPVEKILFWASDEAKDYIATKPLHDSQVYYKNDAVYREQYPELHGGCFFSIECRKNYELISLLYSYGKNLIVLSPESIQKEIIDRINESVGAYLDLRK